MQQYRFTDEVNEKIVSGILNGYKNYVEERNHKYRTMKISAAYAWVKGNHIDDQMANECKEIGITYNTAKAGYTWGYLQFHSGDTKSMFIVKNAKYFNSENFPKGKGIKVNKKRNNDENYLKKLSEINYNIDFPADSLFSKKYYGVETLSIFDDNILKSLEKTEVSKLKKEYEKFYIVTYEIDEAYMISEIKVWMPNPVNDRAYEVDDLSHLIELSAVSFDDIDTDILDNDDQEYDYNSPAATHYEIYHESEFDKSKDGSES